MGEFHNNSFFFLPKWLLSIVRRLNYICLILFIRHLQIRMGYFLIEDRIINNASQTLKDHSFINKLFLPTVFIKLKNHASIHYRVKEPFSTNKSICREIQYKSLKTFKCKSHLKCH